MKIKHENRIMVIILVIMSAILYFVHFEIFKDSHHIFIYLLGDIAFLPIEIVFVSLIFHKIIEDKEKKNTLRKLNMLIGVFFSEMGSHLLSIFTKSDNEINMIKKELVFTQKWGKKDFENAINIVDGYKADVEDIDFDCLRNYLAQNRDFLLKIIENPTLLEHEFFSELMMALFHLQEELINRKDVSSLTQNDINHLKNDIARVYGMLLKDWLLYVLHLKNEYPYLFSFALRTNPFDENAKVEIT